MTTHREIASSCHCGNIALTVYWPGPGEMIPVRECGCGFCVKHGGRHTSHPEGRVDVRIADDTLVERYRFGTRTADFHICRTCGAEPLITSSIDGRLYAVVNVNCFDGVDADELVTSASDFDGEAVDDRLARRARNWIADVRFLTQD